MPGALIVKVGTFDERILVEPEHSHLDQVRSGSRQDPRSDAAEGRHLQDGRATPIKQFLLG